MEGKLRMDEWSDKQTNARRTRLYLLVENWQFTQYKRQEETTPDAAAPSPAHERLYSPSRRPTCSIPRPCGISSFTLPSPT